MKHSIRLERLYDSKPWVAEITGFDKKFGFQREFIGSQVDYSHSNKKGMRRVYHHFLVEDGSLYEVFTKVSFGKDRRYFCRIETGKEIKMDMEEVRAFVAQLEEIESCQN